MLRSDLSISLFSFFLVYYLLAFFPFHSHGLLYFFLLSSPRAYVTDSLKHCYAPSSSSDSRSHPIRFIHFSIPHDLLSFSLSLFSSLTTMQNQYFLAFIMFPLSCSPSAQHPPSFLKRSILPILFSLYTRLLLPFPLSFLLRLLLSLLSSSVIRLSRLRRSVSSSPLFQLSSIFRVIFSSQWWNREKINLASRVMRNNCILPESLFVRRPFYN